MIELGYLILICIIIILAAAVNLLRKEVMHTCSDKIVLSEHGMNVEGELCTLCKKDAKYKVQEYIFTDGPRVPDMYIRQPYEAYVCSPCFKGIMFGVKH